MSACEGGGICGLLSAENSCWIEPGLRLLCCSTGFGVHLQREQEAVGHFWLLITVKLIWKYSLSFKTALR